MTAGERDLMRCKELGSLVQVVGREEEKSLGTSSVVKSNAESEEEEVWEKGDLGD